MTEQVAHTAKVCTKVNHDFLKHGGMNFCPDCGANVRDEANSLVRAAAPELLSEARINLGVLKEVHAYLRNRTGNLEVQLCEMVGESISHSEAAISKAETECPHGVSFNEPCDLCDYELDLEYRAAQEDAERDAMRRWQR